MLGAARILACATLLVAATACGPAGGGPSRPRHLVFVSLDTLGARHVGAYGHEGNTTPTFDALAAEGALFERAYTNQTHTLTTHISMMTGLYPQVHGANESREAAPGAVTLAELLRNQGFETLAFTTMTTYTSPRFGLGRGFDSFESMIPSGLEANARLLPSLRAEAGRAESDPEHRIFLFVHYYDVHSDVDSETPYTAPRPFVAKYVAPGLRDVVRGDTRRLFDILEAGGPSEQERASLNAYYDAGVNFTDKRVLGLLVHWLDELGLEDETLLVVTADHGEEIFEHGMPVHTQPYEETARVPLLMVGPGIPAGLRIPEVVETVDVMPTILDLLGLPVPEQVQGRVLTPLLRGEHFDHSDAFVDGFLIGGREGTSAWIEQRDGHRWSYVRRLKRDGDDFTWVTPGELYDVEADPGQRNDVAAAHPEVAARLAQQLLERLRENDEAGRALGVQPASRRSLLSEEDREALRGLGYVE